MRRPIVPVLLAALLAFALLPATASATTISTTVTHGGHPAVSGVPCQDEVEQTGGLLCRVDVRTTVSSPDGFDVQMGFGWIGSWPTGLSYSFDHDIIHCPASADAACGRVNLTILADATTSAPASASYHVYATRLCDGAPCDGGADTSSFSAPLAIKRLATGSISCDLGFEWPIFSTNPCTVVLVDAGLPGVPSRPTSPPAFQWGIFFNYGTAPCDLQPVAGTDFASQCTMDYSSNLPDSQLGVGGHWDGDAAHGFASVGHSAILTPRHTAIDADCPSFVYAGDMATCDIAVIDGESVPINANAPGRYGELILTDATNTGRSTGHVCDIVDNEPASCDLSFTPTGNATLGLTFDANLYWLSSSVTVHIARLMRPTLTTLTCDPAFIPVNATTTCTAVVADSTAHAAPLGTVDLVGTTCDLAPVAGTTRSSCNASFTAPLSTVGSSLTLAASYRGTSPHAASSGTYVLDITKRATTTDVSCDPDALIPLYGPAPRPTCAAFVNDTSAGGIVAPTGNVSWTSVPPESFTDALDQGNCTLAGGSCSIGAVLPIGDQMLTGTYAGDDYHVGAVGADLVHVHAATATAYAGPTAIARGTSFTPRALLLSASALCYQDRAADLTGVSFSLDRDPTTGVAGAFALSAGPVGTDHAGVATLAGVPTAGWNAGVYTLTARFVGDPYCDTSADTTRLVVGDVPKTLSVSGTSAIDSKTTLAAQAQRRSNGTVDGSIQMQGATWKLVGTIASTARASDGTARCAADGVGALYVGTTTNGKTSWQLAAGGASVPFSLYTEDRSGTPDVWSVHLGRIAPAPEATFPVSSLVTLANGEVTCK